MKTKRRNYWSFFWRVGAGFLAFLLVVMTRLSLLLSWQTAQEMQKEMDIEAYHFIREWVPEQLYFYAQNTDEVLLQDLIGGAFLWFDYRTFNEDVRPSETGVLSGSGEVIQSNQSWVRVIEPGWQEKIDRGEFAPTYYVVMDNQPREVITMLVECNMLYNMDDVTIEGWLDHNKVYPKSISGQPAAWVVQENGDAQRENTAARRTIDCTYNASQMAGRELKTFELNNTLMPSISDLTPEQMVDILTSPRRMALREWVTTKHEGTADQKTVCKPWIVSYAAYHVIPTAAVPEGYVVAQYASEGYPIKECLPTLVPVWGFSFALAVLFSAILAFALLRVWRRQERVEQARRDTTAALAHELKTPLSVLSATAELLSDDMAQDKRTHYLDVIRQQAERMDGSVKRMLELSRLEAGAKALRRARFTLSDLAQERLDAAVPPDADLQTEVTVSGAEEIDADRTLLARALDAILENAVQHTAPGGSIAVRIEKGVCAVVNTGAAIPAEALPRLWEAYYQADASRAAKGDGLGLSIAKTVFDLHGYAYGAENTDEGPRFWFRFG